MGFHKWRSASSTWETLKPRARELREAPTDAEDLLWSKLRGRKLNNAKFRRQHAIGPYITDFCCSECKLVVELDGGIHEERTEEDAARTRDIEAHGFRVIRFGNEDVLERLDDVLARITAALTGRAKLVPDAYGTP